jgi:hypothetical protein
MSDDKGKQSGGAWGSWNAWFDSVKICPPVTRPAGSFFGVLFSGAVTAVLLYVAVKLGRQP